MKRLALLLVLAATLCVPAKAQSPYQPWPECWGFVSYWADIEYYSVWVWVYDWPTWATYYAIQQGCYPDLLF
jgi:hypothetical protein